MDPMAMLALATAVFLATHYVSSRFDEIGWGKLIAGLVLYFVLAFLHPYLFGARPY